ncbi:MAG: acetate--CoA ligase family protein, partial [Pseudomonadales bacterium]|nr:acetate--CoA ligase family protein [Pseudomonadales bacterium]
MNADPIRALIAPRSVALVGASDRPGSLGQIVLARMLDAGYAGELALVNPAHDTIAGRPTVASVRELAEPPELAVIVTPAATVPELVDACGAAGIRAAIVISAGFRETGPEGLALEREVLRRARAHGLRLIGPNCLGVLRTSIGFDATFGASPARRGRIAVVSQSGALCTAILDWAQANDVGFSSLVSLGISADVGFGEVLDFLVTDPETDSIMLYIEGITEARHFMSALRAAARVKPVVVMKVGRHAAGSKAALSHTGALVGADDVFDAALRRAGVLRILDFADFFAAAEILDTGLRTRGKRLAIITNAGGPGVMAADHCTDRDLPLASLAASTLATLEDALPPAAARANPVDVLGDADPDRYEAALRACLADKGVDGALVILTPQAQSAPEEVALRLVTLAKAQRKPVLTCWMGDPSVATSRAHFRAHDVPTFATPEAGVDAFAHLAAYGENQAQLLQVPEPLGLEGAPDVDGARMIIDAVLADGRRVATLAESKALLAAFGIPILRSLPARSAADAVVIAEELGFPVAMKIDSPDISHKSDVDGVVLGVDGARAVQATWQAITERARAQRPDARIDGVLVEPMWQGNHGRELMIGVLSDPVFGPVVGFGLGGTL